MTVCWLLVSDALNIYPLPTCGQAMIAHMLNKESKERKTAAQYLEDYEVSNDGASNYILSVMSFHLPTGETVPKVFSDFHVSLLCRVFAARIRLHGFQGPTSP